MKLGFAELFSFFSSKKVQNTMPCGCFLLTTSVPLIQAVSLWVVLFPNDLYLQTPSEVGG